MTAILTPGPIALYARVASMLRERIRAGEWKLGEQLPTVEELSQQYGVAEITLRQAVKTLGSEGLLLARRGKGTFVAGVPVAAESVPIDTVIEQFSAMDPTHRIEILSREKEAPAPLWDWSPGRPATSYTRVSKVHMNAAGEPYALMQMHVESAVYRRLPPRADERDKIIRLVRQHGKAKITWARERITIGLADFAEIGPLKCPAGLPVARLKRAFMDDQNTVVVYGATTYRGDRVVMERDFTRSESTK